jgi:RNA polymerase nonessential primary-like sigma factor
MSRVSSSRSMVECSSVLRVARGMRVPCKIAIICFLACALPVSSFQGFSALPFHRTFEDISLSVATQPNMVVEPYRAQSIVLYPHERLHDNVVVRAAPHLPVSGTRQEEFPKEPVTSAVLRTTKERQTLALSEIRDDAQTTKPTKRPRNRPNSVLGATGKLNARLATELQMAKAELDRANVAAAAAEYSTMAAFMARKKNVSSSVALSSTAANVADPPVIMSPLITPAASSPPSTAATEASPKKRRGRPRKHPLPGDGKTTIKKITTVTRASAIKRRGRKPKGGAASSNPFPSFASQAHKKATLGKRATGAPSSQVNAAAYSQYPANRASAKEYRNAFHKYYQTKLLDGKEEYSLGMQVRFMMQAEDVHQGLSAHLMRLPSIGEWAEACGFISHDKLMSASDFQDTTMVAMIRPQGSEDSFPSKEELELESRMFLGDKGMGRQGPGRGKGRHRKKPPQLALDVKKLKGDVREVFPETVAQQGEQGNSYGSPRDFVNVMNQARAAKQKMVESNMRLVVSIARRYHSVDGVGIPDLVQEGSMGLMRAVEKFDPTKGFKFSTYASWWIQQAIFRSMAYHSRTIRLPVHVHNLLSRIRRVRGTLQYELGRTPTTPEIASELGMPTEKLAKMLRLTRKSISMDMPKYQQNPRDVGHSSGESVGDMIDSSRMADNNSPELSVDSGLFQEDLKDMLNILGDDERKVISLRYGLYDGLTRTVTAVADQLQATKSWVRSQECRALRKLRRPWYEKRLKEHQDSLTNYG